MPLTEPLTNPQAERVKSVRALAQQTHRRRSGRFLVEGPQAVREVLRFQAHNVREVYLTDAAQERWPEILSDALAADLRVYPCTPAVHERLSPDAQGVLAVVQSSPRELNDLDLAGARLVVVCEEVRDPGNAGTIVRAADATGADAVIFTTGSVEVTNPKVVRSSAGSIFHLPVVTGVRIEEALAALSANGLTTLAADAAGDHNVETTQLLRERTAWLLGNEARGISDVVRERADAVVAIPLRGHAESLNVAMAATVVLAASARAHGSD